MPQPVKSHSGTLITTEEYQCMETKFNIDEGPASDRRLCPGEYTVRCSLGTLEKYPKSKHTRCAQFLVAIPLTSCCSLQGLRDE